jgi:CheY-like chemotaxis protein
MSRIWQPFFTTKSPEVGTGLGLSISRGIVERAGGTIVAESPVPGDSRGTRFLIRLPVAMGNPVGVPQTPPGAMGNSVAMGNPVGVPETPPEGGQAPRRAHVLIVEDEAALARVLADEIGAQHDVVVASSAPAALAQVARARFDVILCDLCMPGMSGEALYDQVRVRDPKAAEGFVFMTGVGFGAEHTHFLAEAGRVVLEKPFPASRALEAIARMAQTTEGTPKPAPRT